jgi:hypothetical protein
MNGHGGHRENAGRPAGTPNRATVDQKATLSELAREHTATAFDALIDVCENGLSESARIAAATAILDRGYGKPRETEQDQDVAVNLPFDGWSISRADAAL